MRLPRRHDGTCSAVADSAAVDAGDLSELELVIEDELADPCAHRADPVELCRCFPNWTRGALVPQLDDCFDHRHDHHRPHLRGRRIRLRETAFPRAHRGLRADLGGNDGS